MTLSLPTLADLLRPPYMAVLRRPQPVLVPPGSAWTTVVWDRADSDARGGFDPARPDGWRAPVAGMYHAAAAGLWVASPDSLVLECAAVVDGVAVEDATVIHLLAGSARDEFDEHRGERPVIRHARQFAALVGLEPGQVCGLALRHSLPSALAVGSEGVGLGWLVQWL